jgi:hypothetical protein
MSKVLSFDGHLDPRRETGLVWNRSRTARKHAMEPRGSRPSPWIWGTYGPGIVRQLCRYVGTSGAATLRELDREFKWTPDDDSLSDL